jgi:hypothetical protein
MWIAGIEIFIALALVLPVLWVLRQPKGKKDDKPK